MIRSFYSGLLNQPGKKTNYNKLIFRAAISILVLTALLWWLPLEQLLSAIASVSMPVWLLVISGFILGHIFSALKWRLLLRAVDANIRPMEALTAHGAGLFANLCLPSIVGGDVIRAGVVIRNHGNITNIAVGSLADRVNDTLALIMLAAVAAMMIPETAGLATGRIFAGIGALLLVCAFAGLATVYLAPVSRFPDKLANIILKVRQALGSIARSPGIALTALALSVAIQSGFILLNVVLAREIGIDASVALWFFAWPLAKLIALAPVSLGGIGVREVAIAGLMAPFGIDAALVVAQSLSWEAVLIGSGLFAGLIVTLLPGNTPSRENKGELS